MQLPTALQGATMAPQQAATPAAPAQGGPAAPAPGPGTPIVQPPRGGDKPNGNTGIVPPQLPPQLPPQQADAIAQALQGGQRPERPARQGGGGMVDFFRRWAQSQQAAQRPQSGGTGGLPQGMNGPIGQRLAQIMARRGEPGGMA